MKLNFACKSCGRPASAREWLAWSLVIDLRGVITMLGCHCRKGEPQCNNDGAVTEGKRGRNSSDHNKVKQRIVTDSFIVLHQ